MPQVILSTVKVTVFISPAIAEKAGNNIAMSRAVRKFID
jgi:hypothetical protein